MRSYFKVTQYDEVKAAETGGHLVRVRIAQEVFFFFEDNSPIDTAQGYEKASALLEELGRGTRLAVWRVPCIAVQAHLVGKDSRPEGDDTTVWS